MMLHRRRQYDDSERSLNLAFSELSLGLPSAPFFHAVWLIWLIRRWTMSNQSMFHVSSQYVECIFTLGSMQTSQLHCTTLHTSYSSMFDAKPNA